MEPFRPRLEPTRILNRNLRWCCHALLALLPLLCICDPTRGQSTITHAAKELENRVRQASRKETFRPPSTDELRAAERLFARTLRGDEPFEVLRDAWSAQHFDLEIFESQNQRLWLLRESESHQTGRGFYAFRPTTAMPVVLESPHSFADTNTRRITAQVFLDSQFVAAAWNTVHRKIVDVAHTDACLLNSFTRAALRVHHDDAVVCQLHGFARGKRKTDGGRTSDLIVSNGTRSGDLWLQRAVSSLREMPDIAVRLYPDEVSELGATTNRQARLVRENGVGKFLHLEMSAELRSALISQPAMHSELLKVLERAFRTEIHE